MCNGSGWYGFIGKISTSTTDISLGSEINHNLEITTYDPLKYEMGSSILIASISVGKSIRILRVSTHPIMKHRVYPS